MPHYHETACHRVGSFAMLPYDAHETYQQVWKKLPTIMNEIQILLRAHAVATGAAEPDQDLSEHPLYIIGGSLAFGFRRNSSDIDFHYAHHASSSEESAKAAITEFAEFVQSIRMPWRVWAKGQKPVVHLCKASARHRTASYDGCVLSSRTATTEESEALHTICAEKFSEDYDVSFTSCGKVTLALREDKTFASVMRLYCALKRFLPKAEGVHSAQWTIHVQLQKFPEMVQFNIDICLRSEAVQSSLLLREYLLQNPFYRQGALYIKRWSKKCGLSKPGKGLLCSYVVVILWVFFLMYEKGCLRHVPLSLISASEKEQDVPSLYVKPVDYQRRSTLAQDRTTTALGALVTDFFVFYAQKFDFAMEAVSLDVALSGERAVKNAKEAVKERRAKYGPEVFAVIEDPYGAANLSKGLNSERFTFMKTCFQKWLRTHQPTIAIAEKGK